MEAILFAVMAATIICLFVHIWVERKVKKMTERFMKENYIVKVKDDHNLKGKD